MSTAMNLPGLLLASVLLAAGCGGGAHGVDDASLPDRLPDRLAQQDRLALPDVLQDASDTGTPTRPVPVTYDFCDQPVFEFPRHPTQTLEVHFSALDATGLVYYTHDSGRKPHDEIFLLDLSSCMEYPLAPLVRGEGPIVTAFGPNRLVLAEYVDNNHQWDRIIDLRTWADRVLYQDGPNQYQVNEWGNNDHYVVFTSSTVDLRPPFHLTLYNLKSLDSTELWSGDIAYSYLTVTDSFVLFEPRVAVSYHCYDGAATYYLDLTDLSMGMVPGTCDRVQHGYFGARRRVGYMSSDSFGTSGFTCVVRDMDLGQDWVLTQDDITYCLGGMDEHVVFWTTGAYRTDGGTEGYLFGDIMAMDLDTGVQRRLTSEPVHLAVADEVSLPWAVFFVPGGGGAYYVVNLERLGVVDDQGHLLAGPPVDEIMAIAPP